MRRAARKAQIPLDVLVDAQAKAAGWPVPEREVVFAPPRKFRFDYGWHGSPEHPYRLALEIDGGIWTKGGHSTGKGILRDMEKLNHATWWGWSVLRLTPQQVRAGELQAWLEKMR